MIDEAHERNLNTDIVLGIAKLLRAQRPDNFFVLIASATIDPKPFLDFFNSPFSSLDVPGRIFPVSLEYVPPPSDLSPRQLLSEHVIPIVMEALDNEKYPKGHMLVFLPGQAEIEQAIKAFTAASGNHSQIVAFPLFGSLPPEEQDRIMQFNTDDTYKGQRMIVFSTNVAETSLTIPGVTLVIDIGLAKEVRYDTARRINVIELVRVSRSSAEQRKGRAGRMSSGVCIRLYAEEDLVRENIEPEIARASLDSVILQLIRLGYNPYLFPFMTKPSLEALQNSVEILECVNCIKRNHGSSRTNNEFTITDTGRLFSDLPFDPRMSAFVVACHRDYDKLILASVIASVISAPGNIHFMGGANKEAKEEARRRIAARSSNFDSDLLCLAAIFKAWFESGMCNSEGHCVHCGRLCPRDKGCRPCRVKHSVKEGLNNKILDFIMNMSSSVQDTIKRAFNNNVLVSSPIVKNGKNSIIGDDEDLIIVSECLVRYFSEMSGEVLIPEHPADGVYLKKIGVRARIANSSTFLQRVRADPFRYFVALSVTLLPSGEYICDQMHPLTMSGNTPQVTCIEIYVKHNISYQIVRHFKKWHVEQMKRTEYYWSVCVYDATAKSLKVYNINQFERVCNQEITIKVQALIDDAINQVTTAVVGSGQVEIELTAGMKVISMTPIPNSFYRIKLNNIPIQSVYDFRSWMSTFFDKDKFLKTAVKWAKAFPPSNDKILEEDIPESNDNGFTGVVILSDENVVNYVKEKAAQYIVVDNNSTDITSIKAKDFIHKEKFESKLNLNCDGDVNESFVQNILQSYGVTKVIVVVKTEPKYVISIRNLPIQCNYEWFTSFLFRHQVPVSNVTIASNNVGSSTYRAYLTFKDNNNRNRAYELLEQHFANTNIKTSTAYQDKKGRWKTDMVMPEMLIAHDKDIPGRSLFSLVFNNSTSADYLFNLPPWHVTSILGCHCTISGWAEIKIKYIKLFPYLEYTTLTQIQSRFNVQCKLKRDSKNESSGKIELTGACPSTIAKAVKALKAVTSTIVLMGSTEKQKSFYTELSKSLVLKAHATELNLVIDWEKGPRGEIHGERVQQGALMSYIAECYDDFEKRYSVVLLTPTVNNLFKNGNVGDKMFRDLQKAWEGRCNLKHRLLSSDIVLHLCEGVSPNAMDELNAALDALIVSIGGSENKIIQSCVFCKMSSTACEEFGICGHAFCARCLAQKLLDMPCGVMCAACHMPVSVRDIKGLLTSDQFIDLCNKVIKKEIIANKSKYRYRSCPNSSCSAIIPFENNLQICMECHLTVCLNCELAMESPNSHEGRNCDEYNALLQSLMNMEQQTLHIISSGKQYATDNWPVNLSAISRIFVNVGLSLNCPAYEKFLAAVAKGYAIDKGFFAWHGTTESAIGPICDTGFDPKRRSGQAYGPGEYFGVDANVSKGYARDCKRLILTYILESNNIKHQPQFCYVVNNPTDWSFSYCLPVLVINFDGITSEPSFVVRAATNKNKFNSSFEHLSINDNKSIRESEAHQGQQEGQWYWEDDRRTMQPYKDDVNQMLESQYYSWKYNRGNHIFITPHIIRYVDDIPQRYRIDFQQNKQFNVSTEYSRKIERKLKL
jgi:hypothetical protein